MKKKKECVLFELATTINIRLRGATILVYRAVDRVLSIHSSSLHKNIVRCACVHTRVTRGIFRQVISSRKAYTRAPLYSWINPGGNADEKVWQTDVSEITNGFLSFVVEGFFDARHC